MTLSHVHKKVAIVTDPSCWYEGWLAVCDDLETLMQHDRLVDTLLHALDAAYAYLAPRVRADRAIDQIDQIDQIEGPSGPTKRGGR